LKIQIATSWLIALKFIHDMQTLPHMNFYQWVTN